MNTSPYITIVTGPLGAGKTTLLNLWLGAFERVDATVIVNEFGDVGVDGELLSERVKEVVELTGGCLCCTTQADLVRALLDLSARVPPPKRVFVETSGVASPSSVVRSITRGPVSRRMRLDGVVTVLDATRLERLRESLLVAEQAAYADVIVLSRAGSLPADARADALSAVARYNPAAIVAWATRGALNAPAVAPGTPPAGDVDTPPRPGVRAYPTSARCLVFRVNATRRRRR